MNSLKASFPWKPKLGLNSYNHNLIRTNPSLRNLVCIILLFGCLIQGLQPHVPTGKSMRLAKYESMQPDEVCGEPQRMCCT